MEANAFLTKKEEKPLTTCKECKQQECIKTGKVCKKIESYLNACQAKDGYSDRHIRRKEIPYDSQYIEQLASRRALEIRYGKKWAENEQRKAERFME